MQHQQSFSSIVFIQITHQAGSTDYSRIFTR
jgi:hypothetical protein